MTQNILNAVFRPEYPFKKRVISLQNPKHLHDRVYLDSLSCKSRTGLDLPHAISDGVEIQTFCNLWGWSSSEQVLLVGKDKNRNATKLLLVQQLGELLKKEYKWQALVSVVLHCIVHGTTVILKCLLSETPPRITLQHWCKKHNSWHNSVIPNLHYNHAVIFLTTLLYLCCKCNHSKEGDLTLHESSSISFLNPYLPCLFKPLSIRAVNDVYLK